VDQVDSFLFTSHCNTIPAGFTDSHALTLPYIKHRARSTSLVSCCECTP